MRNDREFTTVQEKLITENLSVVHWVIMGNIHVNEHIYGFGYDDLFQEGCIHLCKAAATYDVSLSQFPTYAKKVVKNGLLSYCRQMYKKQRHFIRLELGEHGELLVDGEALQQADEFNSHLSMMETIALLESRKKDYRGVARLGIEALELKIKGNSIKEIAGMYQVSSSNVGAWISRAAKKLRDDPEFLKSIR